MVTVERSSENRLEVLVERVGHADAGREVIPVDSLSTAAEIEPGKKIWNQWIAIDRSYFVDALLVVELAGKGHGQTIPSVDITDKEVIGSLLDTAEAVTVEAGLADVRERC